MGTYLVMKNNFKRNFHHKALFIATFLLPIIICLIASSIKIGTSSMRVGILEEDVSVSQFESRQELYTLLEQTEGIKYAFADEASLNTDLMTGKFQFIMDYRGSDSIDDFQFISYQNEDKNALLEVVLRDGLMRKEIALGGMRKEALTTTERSMALLMTLFMIISTIHASTIIFDRHSGTYIRYRFARKNNSGYILGYILHNFIITYIQMVLCMLILWMFQKGFQITLTQGLSLSFVIAVISTTFSMIICLSSKSEMKANITTSSIAALMSLLGGTFIAVEYMPRLLQMLSMASPVRWVVELIRYI